MTDTGIYQDNCFKSIQEKNNKILENRLFIGAYVNDRSATIDNKFWKKTDKEIIQIDSLLKGYYYPSTACDYNDQYNKITQQFMLNAPKVAIFDTMMPVYNNTNINNYNK